MKSTQRSLLLFAGAAFLLAGFLAYEAIAGDRWTVGVQHAQNSLVSAEKIDHDDWDRLLKKYVDNNGMVDYRGWKANSEDTARLDKYLSNLSRYNPEAKSTRPAQLAFWINAYNAATIKGILREYPTKSIRDHTAKLLGYNIWDDLLLLVGNKAYSLNEMEHKVLRKMGEPRIHFAIVCASIGCPPLLNEAYQPESLDEKLSANTRRFFADPSKLKYDAKENRLSLSPIIKWFSEDFGESQQQRIRLIEPYFPGTTQKSLANLDEITVNYLPYSWDLNEQKMSLPSRE
ncbi:DUF547 domain-containing protein [Adhaeretor mobilis]|uniref:DUF547 domain-containing protein n=1 Tax=Adhaeretor mobilis TaxID=1930276 RepID=A0A517MU56_9BACT|nr:DUF547 domain-containing protein [Adhaeretor mobilis]QDS98409.1 hypothetical protein HG15A2_16850 [Adhaeretor mobilis]